MKIERFVLGPIGTNCYIVTNEETKECFAVDMAACPKEYVNHIKAEGLTMKGLFLTHGHFDHILGIDSFLKEFPVPVYAGAQEQPVMADARLNVASMYGSDYTFTGAEKVEDGQVIVCAGAKIRVIHTPGHTIGGCCYYLEEENALFSGDTLFCASVGRTDLPTGSSSTLVRSVREKLMCLPDETRVYPGHMDETSIAYEKQQNPFI